MKKNTLYGMLLMAGLLVVACTKNDTDEFPMPGGDFVEIPDVNFEKELLAQGIDSDGILNHKIVRSDAEKVTKLSLYNANINSLSGIEGFTNLKRLYANGNNLQTVDVSHNIHLDSISLISNDLTKIDGLSNAKELVWLSLSWNLFTEFTLDNENVKNFLMDHNQLVSLEIANAPKLESAVLNLNEIPSLDFSNSPLLKVLNFSANKVTTIDLNQNVNLEYIYCSSNLLTAFDLSTLPNLIDVRIDRNPTLTCIKIAPGQQIPTLKLSSYQQANVVCD